MFLLIYTRMSHHLLMQKLFCCTDCRWEMPEISAALHTEKSDAVGHPGDFGMQNETFHVFFLILISMYIIKNIDDLFQVSVLACMIKGVILHYILCMIICFKINFGMNLRPWALGVWLMRVFLIVFISRACHAFILEQVLLPTH